MLKYKIDILGALWDAGYDTGVLRRKKILPESVISKIRAGDASISASTIGTICSMLRCQPGDILQNDITEDDKKKLFLDELPKPGRIRRVRRSRSSGADPVEQIQPTD